MSAGRAGLLAVLALAACDARLDVFVDATAYAEASGASRMAVDVVLGGEPVAELRLDLATATTARAPDAVLAPARHGVIAFADVDGDGRCDPGVDDGWLFFYDAVQNGELAWTVDRDTFADVGQACGWFSGNTGADVDDTDAG